LRRSGRHSERKKERKKERKSKGMKIEVADKTNQAFRHYVNRAKEFAGEKLVFFFLAFQTFGGRQAGGRALTLFCPNPRGI
jgi:hypothetical protein